MNIRELKHEFPENPPPADTAHCPDFTSGSILKRLLGRRFQDPLPGELRSWPVAHRRWHRTSHAACGKCNSRRGWHRLPLDVLPTACFSALTWVPGKKLLTCCQSRRRSRSSRPRRPRPPRPSPPRPSAASTASPCLPSHRVGTVIIRARQAARRAFMCQHQ